VDEQDMRLVVAMRSAKDGPMGVAQVADAMQMTREEALELLENCRLRGIVRKKKMKNVIYDPEKCWGCGLCANTCAPDAITMKALDVPVSPQSEEPHVH